jgi:hypothetical protein
MRRKIKLLAGLASALLAVAATAAEAQTAVQNPPDPWIHAPTGTPFPARVGDFERGRVVEYSTDGRDASAGYSLRRGNDWASVTLYVYPVFQGMDCQATFADVKRNIAAHKGAALVSEGRTPGPSGRGGPTAYHARYQVPAGAMGEKVPEVRSEAYLYCPAGNEWLVKYRATWNAGADFSKDVEALLHEIKWPKKLGG